MIKIDEILLMEDGTKITDIHVYEFEDCYICRGILRIDYVKPICFQYDSENGNTVLGEWYNLIPDIPFDFPTESYYAVCNLYRNLISEKMSKIYC